MKTVAKYKIGQLAFTGHRYALVTGVVNRGTSFAYELTDFNDVGFVNETEIVKAYTEVTAAAPRTRTVKTNPQIETGVVAQAQ